jgi:hypothetical protein
MLIALAVIALAILAVGLPAAAVGLVVGLVIRLAWSDRRA